MKLTTDPIASVKLNASGEDGCVGGGEDVGVGRGEDGDNHRVSQLQLL